jgi:hypothetical protein
MGIEYAHAIVVADLAWRPTSRHVEAVTAVLEAAGFRRETARPPATTLPANLTVAYDGITGARVRELVGPPSHPIPDDDLYIHEVVAIFGVDFEQPMAEEYEADIIAAPEVPPNRPDRRVAPMHLVFPATWDSSATTRPTPRPVLALGHRDRLRQVSPGDPRVEPPPPRPRARARSARAFGTALVELGWHH